MNTDIWWKRAVVYQIYPRSFQDSNGDGIGDLLGIIQRLDYLKWLGVDAIWLSPIYPSPMQDFGYDITDYTDVDPRFGCIQDFDALVEKSHALGIRLILDVVPNHTSSEHPWFLASRQSQTNAKRDWYIWRNPQADGGPPNNWRSVTGGSAWSLDEQTGQYYLHSFLPCEPDLNWRSPDVQAAVADALHFWLKRGVDGLRIDMVDFLIKDAAFRDEAQASYTFATAQRHLNQPEVTQTIEAICQVVESYPNRVAIGEINPGSNVARTASYYGKRERLQPFNFGLLGTPFEAAALKDYIQAYEAALPANAWPNYTLGNHDTPRLTSRLGQANSRLAALLLLTLRGTPYLYYGDELGLENVVIPSSQIQDVWEMRQPGKGRDPCRTPMPWRSELGAGFTQGEAWLPVGKQNKQRSVERQQQDESSLLMLYRRLLAIRKRSPALLSGKLQLLDAPPEVLMYKRELDKHQTMTILNFSQTSQVAVLTGVGDNWQIVLSTQTRMLSKADCKINLLPLEGILLSSLG